MAQVDVQWPSEDEDFDATIDKAIKSRENTTDKDNKPQRTAVAVQEPEVDEAENNTPESISNEPAEHEAESESASEEESQQKDSASEPESADEHQPETESIPAETPPPPVAPVAQNSAAGQGGKSNMGRTIFEVVLVLAVVGLAVWSSTLMSEKNDSQAQVTSLKSEVQKLNDNPQIAVQKQTDDLLKKVGALMDLPQGETPTVANVSDAEAAKKQSAFFNNARNGDRVLMYVKAGQAILYRPSTDKIVLVAPLTFSDTAAKTSTTTTTPRRP